MGGMIAQNFALKYLLEKYFGFEVVKFKNTQLPLEKVLVEWLEKNEVLVCSLQNRIVELKAPRE